MLAENGEKLDAIAAIRTIHFFCRLVNAEYGLSGGCRG